MIDIFDIKPLKMTEITCHSGGAVGADSFWETLGEKWGVKTRAYSWKTPMHQSINKVEISQEDYNEGVVEVNKANKWLNRYGIHKYMNLLARNWAQVKYSKQVFAIGVIIKKGDKNSKGYYNKGKWDVIDGGTGYCCQMAINHGREVFVYDLKKNKWFRWSYSTNQFVENGKTPKITQQDFAGVGTREITPEGVKAIEEVYRLTFES